MTSSAMVQIRAARKAQLVQKLGVRERALFEAELKVRDAKARAVAEREDVFKLEDLGPSELLLSLTGRLEKRIETEREEAAVAYREWRRQEDCCGRLRIEVERTRAAIAAMGTPESGLAKIDDDASAGRTRDLMLTAAALAELYEAQDALQLMRPALARAERWAKLVGQREGPARANAETIATTSYERFGAFQDELGHAIRALEDLGEHAPKLVVPEPESLRYDLADAWERHKTFAVLEPRWDELAEALRTAIDTLETWTRNELDIPVGPDWNVGSLFMPS